jgi:uncharacterized membrane protein YkvA (DUF1232 family)
VDWLAAGVVVVAAPRALLGLRAARLPEGTLEDLVAFVPACATTARRLRADPRVPRRAKLAVGLVLLWVLSPIDLVPEFLPVIGPVDDIVVVALALRLCRTPGLTIGTPRSPARQSRRHRTTPGFTIALVTTRGRGELGSPMQTIAGRSRGVPMDVRVAS